MTTCSNLSACFIPGRLRPWVGFWSSFSGAWFDSTWPIADAELCNQAKERIRIRVQRGRRPCRPHLQRMFEAQLAAANTGVLRCLRHQYANDVVSQQVYPHLLDHHLRRQAAQYLHAEGRFDVSAK